MKKLRLNLEDLSVESFSPSANPRGRGTVQGNVEEPVDGGESYDLACEGGKYAVGSNYCSRYTCPYNFSCVRNCSADGPCSETV